MNSRLLELQKTLDSVDCSRPIFRGMYNEWFLKENETKVTIVLFEKKKKKKNGSIKKEPSLAANGSMVSLEKWGKATPRGPKYPVSQSVIFITRASTLVLLYISSRDIQDARMICERMFVWNKWKPSLFSGSTIICGYATLYFFVTLSYLLHVVNSFRTYDE